MPATRDRARHEAPRPDVLLAFDFGAKRLGVATANLRTRTATPLMTLETGAGAPWARIDSLLEEWRPAHLLVGVPEGSAGAAAVARRARAFAAALAERCGLPVDTVDESFTSVQAAAELRDSRRSGIRRRRVPKERVDQHAACLIAEQWMREARQA